MDVHQPLRKTQDGLHFREPVMEKLCKIKNHTINCSKQPKMPNIAHPAYDKDYGYRTLATPALHGKKSRETRPSHNPKVCYASWRTATATAGQIHHESDAKMPNITKQNSSGTPKQDQKTLHFVERMPPSSRPKFQRSAHNWHNCSQSWVDTTNRTSRGREQVTWFWQAHQHIRAAYPHVFKTGLITP